MPHAEPSARSLAELWRANRRALVADHRALVSDGRPAHMKIELTNFCNLRCPHCPHPSMRRDTGYMAPALFRRIIDMAAPELEFAYLHHLGESLFHGQLGALIRYGRARGAAMGLSTNATFLDARKRATLFDAGLDFLVVSLDAASARTYDVMRPGGDFARTVAQVRALLDERRARKAGLDVALQLIVTADSAGDVARFVAEWQALGAAVMLKAPRDWAGQVPLGLAPPAHARDVVCRMPWTELTVLWDGLVVACANFFEREEILGDLSRQSLDEVWNGPAMQAFRRRHADDALATLRVCRGCERHALDGADFVAVDQLAQRRRTYLSGADSIKRGLS